MVGAGGVEVALRITDVQKTKNEKAKKIACGWSNT